MAVFNIASRTGMQWGLLTVLGSVALLSWCYGHGVGFQANEKSHYNVPLVSAQPEPILLSALPSFRYHAKKQPLQVMSLRRKSIELVHNEAFRDDMVLMDKVVVIPKGRAVTKTVV